MSEPSLRSRWATQLPADVIGEILLECIPFAEETCFTSRSAYYSPGPRAMLPISMSHVCREWRQAAISFKKLGVPCSLRAVSLTIILTYPAAGHNHTILGRLLHESNRWRTFFCDVYGLSDASPQSTGLTYAQWTTLAFPELKNVVYFNSGYGNDSDEEEDDDSDENEDDNLDEDDVSSGADDGTNDRDEGDGDLFGEAAIQQHDGEDDQEQPYEKLLQSLPGKVAAQLHRFYSYCTDAEFEEQMVVHLNQATRVRCAFISTNNTHKYFWGTEPGDVNLSLPHADFLYRNDLPNLRGLNLRVGWEDHDAFIPCNGVPMPGYLAKLVVLRLCGRILIADDALTQLVSALSSLVDLTLELQEYGAMNLVNLNSQRTQYGAMNLVNLNSLLNPRLPTIHIPRLEHLRLLPHHKASSRRLDALLPALDARFRAPHGAPYARLRSFTLYHTMLTYWDESEARNIRMPASSALVEHCEQFKVQHSGWNIQIAELQSELWLEPMGGEFILDI
uniref:F-box domain-containing protein n=1 Tax=Mycena chlorophos TaxID=658473 RepID=A0ABQ0LL96_MYCCL|nr:predicted protein [Mycena chlorophos]